MPIKREKVRGELEIKRIPKDFCWGTPTEFVKALQEIYGVDLFVNAGNDFVVIGHQVPAPGDKGRLWIRLSRSGIFQGFFAFQDGKWQRIFNYRVDRVLWMHGDSREIPEGFQLIDANSGQIDPDARDHIVGQYLVDTAATTATLTVYKYFAVRWIGAT